MQSVRVQSFSGRGSQLAPRRAWLGIVLTSVTLGGVSCATHPLDTPEARWLADQPRLPRTIEVSVSVDGAEGVFGDTEAWTGDVVRWLGEKLSVSEGVMPSGTSGVPADLRLDVEIATAAPAPPQVSTQGAFLEVLAWTTIPLLPLWIDDVFVDPGVVVRVHRRRRHGVGHDAELGESREIATLGSRPVSTDMLDRYGFLSWPTLGAIVVPPFLFEKGDSERLESTLADDLRKRMAVRLAEAVVQDAAALVASGEELLHDLRAGWSRDGDALVVAFSAHREVGVVRVWAEDISGSLRGVGTQRIPVAAAGARPVHSYSIPLETLRGARRLRIDAIGRASGRRLPYSLSLDGLEKAGMAGDGGSS